MCPLAAIRVVIYLANAFVLAPMELAEGVVAEQTNAGEPCLLPERLSNPHLSADVAVVGGICHVLLLAKSEVVCGTGHGGEVAGRAGWEKTEERMVLSLRT